MSQVSVVIFDTSSCFGSAFMFQWCTLAPYLFSSYRASSGESLRFLLQFLKSISDQYTKLGKAGKFVLATLKLNTPWLFSVLGSQPAGLPPLPQPSTGVRQEFVLFLQQYIQKNSLSLVLQAQVDEIWVSILLIEVCMHRLPHGTMQFYSESLRILWLPLADLWWLESYCTIFEIQLTFFHDDVIGGQK